MSESIAEMVIPGTYIEVRAEGLIAVGAISTGTIGIVGTAARGPVETAVPIGSFTEATDIFGQPDAFASPRVTDAALTLTRALEQAYAGGARNVVAVRIANGSRTAATLAVSAVGANQPAFTLTARGTTDESGAEIAGSSGTWGQNVDVEVVADSTTSPPTWRMTIAYGQRREIYEGANVGEIHGKLAGSTLVQAGAVQNPGLGFTPLHAPLTGGTDGANVSAADVLRGLTVLESQPVNILLVAGLGANVVGTTVLGHLDRTEAEGRERIAILGARASGTATSATGVEADAAGTSDDRIVLVAPGLVTVDAPTGVTGASGATGVNVSLPPPYLAAVVAGKLSTLAPQVSLTNKVLPVVPDVRYSTALTQNLLQSRVLLVRQKFGAQVVKGITSAQPPFTQISIRRIVDYAKAGVRLGSDPYIGRLNNNRVRKALQATLDGFLSQMVLDEMLVGYQLEVSASRAQERAGICSVVMTLLPTFSIDYIRVTMNLE
ncbi:phage tail sheath C-terminal domain-containing protein [Streptomyces sp. SID13031]|uniref:phage tail sheath C-terminal domain-containing protein n=1 Tax=Streptomyces sp. SID13031 TaxID=2706046 RepID=UPI0013CDB266|nr:phage tail sheath C-terminal domain-containing protein [Streptomyces sp. SID13031]NEA30694.1 phage tail protein [Streptomyces sp. SID13031]